MRLFCDGRHQASLLPMSLVPYRSTWARHSRVLSTRCAPCGKSHRGAWWSC